MSDDPEGSLPDPKALADRAVLGLCELFALLFGLPFGEDLYNDRPITGWHYFYFGIAILFAIGGPMWPLIRMRAGIPESVSRSLLSGATDARIWLAVLLILFIYATGPEIYRRAVNPTAIHDPQSVEDIAKATAPLQAKLDDMTWQRDAALSYVTNLKKQLETSQQAPQPSPPSDTGPINWLSDSQFLVVSGGGPDALIHSVLLQGTSTASVAIKEAYAVSGITGHKQELMANVQYK